VNDLRIGHGFDAHRYGPGDSVTIGGVPSPYERGVVAHSDGDVLLHALVDALLGALALGDIGGRFPDHDPAYAGADSRVLLRDVAAALSPGGWSVVNADATVIAQAPRLAPHVAQMRELIASDLGTTVGRISVKATTTERMGYIGRGEGIAAHAVVLLGRA
jgi:2-C-methyl-D-erythritol 2,4-cyclodiphosphate synthase